MENVNFIETVRERDIDLLIMEEVFASESFRNNLLNKFNLNTQELSFWGCWHSVMDNELGETDVLVGFKESNGNRIVIMLENKIDVSFQPMQPERYVKRGQKGIAEGLWDEFYLCLTAPQAYINNVNEKEFEYFLSYEEILELINKEHLSDGRALFKANMLEMAIDKKKRGYSFITDDVVTNFWQDYYSYIEQNHPKLVTKRPSNKPSRSDWYYFKQPLLDKEFAIVHKWDFGFVDLQIKGMAGKLEEIQQQISLPGGFEFVKAGKSLAIRKRCQSVNKFVPFDNQVAQVSEALNAVEELLELYREYKSVIL